MMGISPGNVVSVNVGGGKTERVLIVTSSLHAYRSYQEPITFTAMRSTGEIETYVVEQVAYVSPIDIKYLLDA